MAIYRELWHLVFNNVKTVTYIVMEYDAERM
jgi:hypothetical protein